MWRISWNCNIIIDIISVARMWTVELTKNADKQQRKLPLKIRELLFLLISEIELDGPGVKNWPNFGKLKGRLNQYHCHLKKGHPTYVACWELRSGNKEFRLIEVYYVGTHEKAPY